MPNGVTDYLKKKVLDAYYKLKAEWDKLAKAEQTIKENRSWWDRIKGGINSLPESSAKAQALKLWIEQDEQHRKIQTEPGGIRTRANDAMTKLREAVRFVTGGRLGGVGSLGIAPLVVIAIVGGVILAISQFYDKVVNRTRQLNETKEKIALVTAGKLPASVLEEKDGGDVFGKLSGALIGIALLLVAPQLLSAFSRGRGDKAKW